jgi:hypothetical protein
MEPNESWRAQRLPLHLLARAAIKTDSEIPDFCGLGPGGKVRRTCLLMCSLNPVFFVTLVIGRVARVTV